MEEKIADKFRRFANLPRVIENRRRLRAMYYLAKNGDGHISTIHHHTPIKTHDGIVRESSIMIVTYDSNWSNSHHAPTSTFAEKLFLYSMDTYTEAGEPPTLQPVFHPMLINSPP